MFVNDNSRRLPPNRPERVAHFVARHLAGDGA